MFDLSNLFGGVPPSITDPETRKWMQQRQMMAAAQAMMEAGQPSPDPRSGRLSYALGQGLKAGAGASDASMDQLYREQFYRYLQQKQAGKAEDGDVRSFMPPGVPNPLTQNLDPQMLKMLLMMNPYLFSGK
jgi:hypothetical protein